MKKIAGYATQFQSTPPCGGDDNDSILNTILHISIHAPMRGRHMKAWKKNAGIGFQSTPPCGGDRYTWRDGIECRISIHAPMRGRPGRWTLAENCRNFNPRPHAGATADAPVGDAPCLFQSTPPCGGDVKRAGQSQRLEISIHAPMRGRRGSDRRPCHRWAFQSTPPCGGDDVAPCGPVAVYSISIHAPMRGRLQIPHLIITADNFNPRPHAGATPGNHM